VARDLVGCRLVVDAGTDHEVVARLVEVEAYLGEDDPASHAHRGPTRRAAIMFGPPGHLYVYLSYGTHHCANVVTEPDGHAGAVLLRAGTVERGEEVVRQRRQRRRREGGRLPAAALLRGPGNLCSGLELTRADNGGDLCGRRTRVSVLPGDVSPPVVVTSRVGISRAGDWPLRFLWAGCEAVSAPRPVDMP